MKNMLKHRLVKYSLSKIKIGVLKGIRNFRYTEMDPHSFHMMAFQDSNFSDNPHAGTLLLFTDQKIKFCLKRIDKLRKTAFSYYRYTGGRIKPEDLYLLCLYKKELKNLGYTPKPRAIKTLKTK